MHVYKKTAIGLKAVTFARNLVNSKAVWGLGVLAFLALLAVFLRSPLFSIKNLVCKTQYGPCSKADEEIINQSREENILFYDTDNLTQGLKGIYLNRTVYIEKVFPGKLSVSIEKRKAIAALRLSDKRELFLVDIDGEIIDQVGESFLPVLTLEDGVLVVGQRLEEKILTAAKITHLVYKADDIKQTKLEGDKLIVQTFDAITVYFPTDRDPQIVVGALQLILGQARIEGKLPKLIDLRYSKPVLTYGQVQSSSGN